MTSNENARIAAVAVAVRAFEAAEVAHDWLHIERVWHLAIRLADAEGANRYHVELAALTHDLDDHKFAAATARPYQHLRAILAAATVSDADIAAVQHIVEQVSWSRGAEVPSTLEARIVQDADRLDAIGAIGVARTFAYSGFVKRPFYVVAEAPTELGPFAMSPPSALTHFAEKIVRLKDRMHTPAARAIAEGRHAFLVEYLRQFTEEFEGKR